MRKTKCPNCYTVIELDENVKVQETVTCPHCKAILEVVRKLPLTLEWGENPKEKASRRLLPRR